MATEKVSYFPDILFVSLAAMEGAERIARLSTGLDELRARLLLDPEVRVVVLEDADGRTFCIGPEEEGGAFPWRRGRPKK